MRLMTYGATGTDHIETGKDPRNYAFYCGIEKRPKTIILGGFEDKFISVFSGVDRTCKTCLRLYRKEHYDYR